MVVWVMAGYDTHIHAQLFVTKSPSYVGIKAATRQGFPNLQTTSFVTEFYFFY